MRHTFLYVFGRGSKRGTDAKIIYFYFLCFAPQYKRLIYRTYAR